MTDDLISILDLANQIGKRKQTIFKIIKRLGIEPQKRANANRRGQQVSCVLPADAERIIYEINSSRVADVSLDKEETEDTLSLEYEEGFFYLLQLEPDHDPGRFKVGFALNLPERLRTLRCAAPYLKIVRSWPCKQLWEKTAIESVTNGCERLHTEVFRAQSLDSVIVKCEQFFELMPSRSRVKKS